MKKDRTTVVDMYSTVDDMLETLSETREDFTKKVAAELKMKESYVSDDEIIKYIKSKSELIDRLVDNYNIHIVENKELYSDSRIEELMYE